MSNLIKILKLKYSLLNCVGNELGQKHNISELLTWVSDVMPHG